jgi:hypothetical protein
MIEKIYKNEYMITCDNCGTGQEFDTWTDAILELEMPENCKECLLHGWKSNGSTFTLICTILLVNGLPHKRRDDCPLKTVEDEEDDNDG